MTHLDRPNAIHKITPPYTSQVRHLSPAEARALYFYIVRLEMDRDHWRDLVAALTAERQKAQPTHAYISTHTERIRCPQCEHEQKAKVEHMIPWNSYCHVCAQCEYIILESEWERVEEETT